MQNMVFLMKSEMGRMMVSIIIPVFNTPLDKLNMCLDSIQRQTYQNYEVILVDNGSLDSMFEQYKTLSGHYPKTRIVQQNSGGVSAARNRGLDEANGAYITYIDSDDLISCFALQDGMNHLRISSADVVISGIRIVVSQEEFLSFHADESSKKIEIESDELVEKLIKHYLTVEGDSFLADYFPNKDKMIGRGPCSKIIRTSVARSVRFPENLPIGEDLIWSIELLKNAKHVILVDNVWYGYVVNGNESAIRKYYGNREVLAKNYLKILWDNNKSYFKDNEYQFAQNVAGEFYSILNFEMLSDKCSLSNRGKRKIVQNCLKEWPWELLKKKSNFKRLCVTHKLLVIGACSGTWIYIYELKDVVKRIIGKRKRV